MEACCAVLATEDRKSDGAPMSPEWGKVGNVPLPLLNGLKLEVEEIEGSMLKLQTERIGQYRDDTAGQARRSVTVVWEAVILRLRCVRGRKGMGGRGLDSSRDTLLRVEQLAKVLGHARHVEDTRRRWPEAIGHPVL
jgi:hypothetical protein